MVGKVFYKQLQQDIFPTTPDSTLKWWIKVLGVGAAQGGSGNRKEFSEDDVRAMIVFQHLRMAGVATDTAVAIAMSGDSRFEFGAVTISINEADVLAIMEGIKR